MTEIVTIIFSAVLIGILLILQHVERTSWHAQEQKLVTAILSKDATEFAHAIKTEKEVPQERNNPDEVELANATDEEFDKFIRQQTS